METEERGGQRREECFYCDQHTRVKMDLMKGGMTMKSLKIILGVIGAIAVAILGFIINLTGDVGAYRAEASKIVAVESAKVDMMSKQVEHIAKIQQTVTQYIMSRKSADSNKPSINVYPDRK